MPRSKTGRPTRAEAEAKDTAREAFAALRAIVNNEKAPAQARVSAAKELLRLVGGQAAKTTHEDNSLAAKALAMRGRQHV